MRSSSYGRGIIAFFIVSSFILVLAQSSKASGVAKRSKASASSTRSRRCNECETAGASKQTKKLSNKASRSSKQTSCYPPKYVDPAISKNLNKAVSDLKRAGIKPEITSTWRSSAHQARLHKCSRNKKCRRQHPGLYYALPPGESLHEAGFAVDIAGVASGPRGSKRLTPRGRRIVQTMKKNGFKWRYGLADPAHFEADPKKHGFRSTKQAIKRSQNKCQLKLAAAPQSKGSKSKVASPRGQAKPKLVEVSSQKTRPKSQRA